MMEIFVLIVLRVTLVIRNVDVRGRVVLFYSERCEKRRGSERHRWYGVGICANKKSLARRATTDTTKIMTF